MRSTLPLVAPGFLFGAGLAVSGMTNPAKVQGFLDLAGEWDPSLAFVMAGAVLSFAIGARLVQRRARPIAGASFPAPAERRIDLRLLSGAALFGIGWGLAGFCPGPAVANLGALRFEALVFVPAMIAGMWLAQRGFGADRAPADRGRASTRERATA